MGSETLVLQNSILLFHSLPPFTVHRGPFTEKTVIANKTQPIVVLLSLFPDYCIAIEN
jgi:hypothetical protein